MVSLFWIAPIFNSLEVKDPQMNSPLELLIINHYLNNGQFGKNNYLMLFELPMRISIRLTSQTLFRIQTTFQKKECSQFANTSLLRYDRKRQQQTTKKKKRNGSDQFLVGYKYSNPWCSPFSKRPGINIGTVNLPAEGSRIVLQSRQSRVGNRFGWNLARVLQRYPGTGFLPITDPWDWSTEQH